ncbi:Fic family protein [Blastococcus sp. TF02A_35]|uniref:Fic family protein n=1 Tax=Blastococcus sp. TF02A-35 TaxID=2559612 RepID=UPI0014314361|nr:Fic family protein [Blastococcus sp. TF02A_35]
MATTSERHGFISFDVDPSRLGHNDWLMIGEAMSKCEHLAGVPLKPEAANELAVVSLERGVQATTAIEGNTLSDDEVKRIVRQGTADVPESREYLQREVLNIVKCIDEIDAALEAGLRLPIDVDRLCRLNREILAGIPDNPEVVPGQLRQHNVAVGPYLAPHWTEVPELTARLVKWLDELRSTVNRDSRREDRFFNAIVAAILAHLYIAWVHPFGNGNGRLARLIEVQILSESGVVPIVATNLLSDHYNKTRNAYYLALQRAQQDVGHFISYALRGFVDELRAQIKVVREENLRIHWESYVYETFNHKPSTAPRSRQREVALRMEAGRTYTPEQVTELTTGLAKKYATCGERTPARDMNDLAKMGLVAKVSHRHYRVLREKIEAFIPPVAN